MKIRPPRLSPEFTEVRPGLFVGPDDVHLQRWDDGMWSAWVVVGCETVKEHRRGYHNALGCLGTTLMRRAEEFYRLSSTLDRLTNPLHPCTKTPGCVGYDRHYGGCETAEDYCQLAGPMACIFEPGHEGPCDTERK